MPIVHAVPDQEQLSECIKVIVSIRNRILLRGISIKPSFPGFVVSINLYICRLHDVHVIVTTYNDYHARIPE